MLSEGVSQNTVWPLVGDWVKTAIQFTHAYWLGVDNLVDHLDVEIQSRNLLTFVDKRTLKEVVPFSKLKEYLKVNAPHVRHYVTEASGTDNNNNNKTHFITENYFITKYTTFVITYLFNYLKIT